MIEWELDNAISSTATEILCGCNSISDVYWLAPAKTDNVTQSMYENKI